MANTEPNITAENTAAHLTENTAERLAENTAVHLIAMAYSGTLDPSTYTNEDILNDVICLTDMVVRAMAPPEADYKWRPERAELLLEAEEIDDARHTELLAGSSLTPEEEERFNELADWVAEHDYGWAGDIYRLAAPAESGETRVAFFTQSGVAVCQYYDTNFLGGPFVDIIEAVQYVIATECEPSDWSFEEEFPERASLERWLSERVSD